MSKFNFKTFVIFVLCISSLRAESSEENSSEDIKAQITKHWGAGIATAENKLKEKCNAVLGEEKGKDAAKAIKEGAETFKNCLSGLFNFSAIPEEIEKARPTGDLDVVFNKYCGKRTAASDCLNTFSDQLKQCLTEDEKRYQSNFHKIIHSLVDFVCHKNGDQIALFFAENGPECLKSQEDNMKKCFKDIFSEYIPDKIENAVVPQITLTKKQCDDIDKYQNCVVNHLKSCDDITPSNLIDSLMRFVKRNLPCNEV